MNMRQALSTATANARRCSAQETFDALHSLSLTRALTDIESAALARAIKVIDGNLDRRVIHFGYVKWTVAMDRRLCELRKRGLSYGTIGRSMGLTKNAVAKRFYRLQEMGLA